jgi:hypothetical protein
MDSNVRSQRAQVKFAFESATSGFFLAKKQKFIIYSHGNDNWAD